MLIKIANKPPVKQFRIKGRNFSTKKYEDLIVNHKPYDKNNFNSYDSLDVDVSMCMEGMIIGEKSKGRKTWMLPKNKYIYHLTGTPFLEFDPDYIFFGNRDPHLTLGHLRNKINTFDKLFLMVYKVHDDLLLKDKGDYSTFVGEQIQKKSSFENYFWSFLDPLYYDNRVMNKVLKSGSDGWVAPNDQGEVALYNTDKIQLAAIIAIHDQILRVAFKHNEFEYKMRVDSFDEDKMTYFGQNDLVATLQSRGLKVDPSFIDKLDEMDSIKKDMNLFKSKENIN